MTSREKIKDERQHDERGGKITAKRHGKEGPQAKNTRMPSH
jgi:hypothetical protein